ncbi:MAG: type 4a pilus biogenesis protein PilO [Candidatus Omnitrophota bacterium]
MKLDKRAGTYIFICLSFIILSSLATPLQIKGLISSIGKIKRLQNNITRAKADIDSKHGVLLEKAQIKKDIEGIDSKIISSQETSALQIYISTKAKENGLEIIEIDSLKTESKDSGKKGKFSYLPIKLEMKGGFHNLGRFFSEIESGEYFFEVKSLFIQTSKPQPNIKIEMAVVIKE